jgi:uncharacterized protein
MTSGPHTTRAFALIDSSAYFALTAPQDRNHLAARAIADQLRHEGWRLFTTNFILAETHALLLSRLNRAVAPQVLTQIDRSATIVRVTTVDKARARASLARCQDKTFSLTDATSFAVMDRLSILWAFTFDSDFAQYVCPCCRPSSPNPLQRFRYSRPSQLNRPGGRWTTSD